MLATSNYPSRARFDALFRRRGRGRLRTGNFLEGRFADLSSKVPGLSSAQFERADVADYVSGSPALRTCYQGTGRIAPDAALACRSECGYLEIQERHVAHGR